jgi:hypothetical protein
MEKKVITPQVKTLTVTNFGARLTRYPNGDINSGLAVYGTTHSVNNFQKPGNLMFNEQPIQIDAAGSVITDMIVCGKSRNESGITYVYAVGHLKRVYKIQVNNPSTNNPSYDNPVLLMTLANSQTFKYGGSIQFYQAGATERIFIGHDAGVTKLNFDGTGETVVGTTSSSTWIADVPRQSVQLQGKMYWTNGPNIAEIDSTELVTTYVKLSPGFPANTQARDIRVTSDGKYAVIVVTRVPLRDITLTTPDTNEITNSESIIAYWNGTDLGYSSFTTIPSFSQTAYYTFGSSEFAFGYDIAGGMVSNPSNKILSMILDESPMPNAVSSNGNILGWMTPMFHNGFLKASLYIYGSLDEEVPKGFWRQLLWPAQGTETDIICVPFHLLVSNLSFAQSTGGYGGNVMGTGRIYFSTLETSSGTTKYKLYSFLSVPGGQGASAGGVYETQAQLFSKKVGVKEVRVYCEPTAANNSFQIDFIGMNGSAISNSTCTYTYAVGTDPTKSQGSLDVIKFTPSFQPTAALGVRITNLGSVNTTIHKIEVDVTEQGR